MDDYQFTRSYLLPGEQITWRGHPEKGFFLLPTDIVMIPFGIFWLVFSLFWEYGVIQSGVTFMAIWGLPFLGIGIYLVFGRLIHITYLRGRTQYVITNKKLIIKKGSKITMYDAKDIPPMTLRMHKNGNGTITFSETIHYRRGRHYSNYFALENIKDPVHAQSAISAMQR
ncbi:MAG: hypothetical protein J6Q53_00030 [Oscillospiraceae bacterium]|nr:hypothetical protein [Oscillospiraceae bacterium]